MLMRGPGIGLDIGSKKIKMARVKKVGKQVQLVKYGSIATPEGSMEAGNILDPDSLGEHIGKLARELKVEGRAVASAVSGQQIYIRNFVMPRMKGSELKEAAIFKATEFLPIPVEEAAIDVFPFRQFEDGSGKKTEVFFVAARRQQVEALDEVCHIAGLKLKTAEIEPLAIYRVMNLNEGDKIIGLLNIGASRSHFSIFKQGLLTSLRSLPLGCSAFYRNIRGGGPKEDIHMEDIDANEDNDYSYLVRDIMSELARSLEYYEMQNAGETVETVYLCGGGSRLKNLDKYLAAGLGRRVNILEYASALAWPALVTEREQWELQRDYTVALGLAAWGGI